MNKQQAVEILAKHLPPSASNPRVLDINGELGSALSKLRPDVQPVEVPGYVDAWSPEDLQPNSVDAITALDYVLNERFLAVACDVLRPGGRLIIVNSAYSDLVSMGKLLESRGFVRILVEDISINEESSTLIRGEKPHEITSTVDRIQQVASLDDALIDWGNYRGRFVNLLIVRTPNLPPWKMDETVQIEWQAAAVASDNAKLLGFSSLPKAVGFLQTAVMQGQIRDINHVAKFKKEVIVKWDKPLLLNPSADILQDKQITLLPVTPADAETPDE